MITVRHLSHQQVPPQSFLARPKVYTTRQQILLQVDEKPSQIQTPSHCGSIMWLKDREKPCVGRCVPHETKTRQCDFPSFPWCWRMNADSVAVAAGLKGSQPIQRVWGSRAAVVKTLLLSLWGWTAAAEWSSVGTFTIIRSHLNLSGSALLPLCGAHLTDVDLRYLGSQIQRFYLLLKDVPWDFVKTIAVWPYLLHHHDYSATKNRFPFDADFVPPVHSPLLVTARLRFLRSKRANGNNERVN